MNDFTPDIIFLRGAPGVGKSTFSRNLKPFLFKGVTIEVGPILKMINAFQDGNSMQYSGTLDILNKMIKLYLKLGYKPIVVVGPMKAARMKNHFIKKMKGFRLLIISFYASENDLYVRIDGRKNGFRNKKVAKKVNIDIQKNRLSNEWVVDTSGKNESEVYNEVRTRIQKEFSQLLENQISHREI